jgi:hypothetical protein
LGKAALENFAAASARETPRRHVRWIINPRNLKDKSIIRQSLAAAFQVFERPSIKAIAHPAKKGKACLHA